MKLANNSAPIKMRNNIPVVRADSTSTADTLFPRLSGPLATIPDAAPTLPDAAPYDASSDGGSYDLGSDEGVGPSSRALSLSRPTLVSPSDAPEVDDADVVLIESERQPATVPSASLPHIPPPPRAPRDLAESITGEALVASAALPLVAIDHRATIEAPQAPAEIAAIVALERELDRLRRRTTWLAVATALSLAMTIALAILVGLVR